MSLPGFARHFAGTLLFLIVFSGLPPVFAQAVMEGEVAVESQDEAAVANGLGQILRNILIEAAGSEEAASHPAAAAAIERAGDFAQTYTFRQETVLQDGVPTRLLYLRAGFDRRTVQGLLREGGIQPIASDGMPEAIQIEVVNLGSAADFARCLVGLRGLPIVRELRLGAALPDRLRLSATVAGGAAALLAGVDEGGVFKPLGTSSADDATVMLELL
jgi:hypothetical protein